MYFKYHLSRGAYLASPFTLTYIDLGSNLIRKWPLILTKLKMIETERVSTPNCAGLRELEQFIPVHVCMYNRLSTVLNQF